MGNDAGNNLGSGGDFTVNSGPFVGARGGSEFWARSVEFPQVVSTANTLESTGLTPLGATALSFVFSFKLRTTTETRYDIIGNNSTTGSDNGFNLSSYSNGSLSCSIFENIAGNTVLFSGTCATASAAVAGTWYSVFVSIDTATNSLKVYHRGALFSYTMTAGSSIRVHTERMVLGYATRYTSSAFEGGMSNMYLAPSLVDLSQEANRNKFVDQLGYPIDLTQQIEDGDIPEPIIYMKFEDTAALGTNSGTGGDFTVNGTVTAADDYTP
tara:strand:- start:40 stop:846 length:807 start_codon:yes stop_codon:yes gene_type:complete